MAERVHVQLVQMEILPGRPRENTARMLGTIAAARQARVDLIVFPKWPSRAT